MLEPSRHRIMVVSIHRPDACILITKYISIKSKLSVWISSLLCYKIKYILYPAFELMVSVHLNSWSVSIWTHGQCPFELMVSVHMNSWSVSIWTHGQCQFELMVSVHLISWSVSIWTHGQCPFELMVSVHLNSLSVSIWTHGQCPLVGL